MKTKALLAAGLLMAASAVSAVAQTVYSVNVVGFINLVTPPGFSLISNQLNSGTNTIGSLFPNPPSGSKVFKFNGTGFDIYQFFPGLGGWFPNGSATLNPGEGCFFQNPTLTNITNTMVGSIAGGSTPLIAGFTIASSIVPQQGGVSTDLRLPTSNGDKVFRYDNVNNRYDIFQFFTALGGWFPSEPFINVGEAFFVSKAQPATWTRTFSAETGPN